MRFQSTPSLRRATVQGSESAFFLSVSIHALLAESDPHQTDRQRVLAVSIHALLAESDAYLVPFPESPVGFNPRPPCGERPNSFPAVFQRPGFNPRPPCGERPPLTPGAAMTTTVSIHALLAESDPLLESGALTPNVSIHALLAESDRLTPPLAWMMRCFNPRPPCGERHLKAIDAVPDMRFQSTPSLRRATRS